MDHSKLPKTLSSRARYARGIIDISREKLADAPLALEETLRKIPGILSVQFNVFSGKLAVEFDPLVISLDKIRRRAARAGEGR